MDTQTILSYLKNLNEHNDREWYHAHKTEYKEASPCLKHWCMN